MALNLGELFGTIGLDASDWDKKLTGAQKSLKTFGVAGAALAATAAGAIGVALTKGIVDSMDIEAGNDKLQAQLGLTEEQAGKAGKAAGSLYANNYGDSMEQIQAATGSVMSSISGMKNASQADIEDITMKALNLASAFEVDVGEAAGVAGQLIKDGLAKDATEAMDLITNAMQGVPEAMRGEILPIMSEYGKHFKTLGIDGTTAFGIVKGAAQDGAIGMDKIGDSLKEFTLLATNPSASVAAAFETIGVSTEEMATGMAKGGEAGRKAFTKVISGLQNIKDPAQQAQTAIALFGTPLEDLGTDNIPQFLGQLDPMGDAFDSVAGAADKMNKDLNSNAKAGFASFQRQADAALIKFVQNNIMPSVSQFASFLNTDVGPAITKLGQWIQDEALPALRGFGDWFMKNKDTISNWAQGIGFILIPLFLRIAISATVSAAAQVVAWATAAGGAIKTAAVYVAQSYIMIGRWVAMGAAALVSAAETAYVWALYKIEAIKGAAAYVVQSLRVAAAWVAMSAAAVASGIKTAAVWTGTVIANAVMGAAAMGIQAAKVVASWVLMSVQSMINAVKMAAAWVVGVGIPAVAAGITMGIQAAIVVAGWVLMGTQAMIQAVKMAAAWFIALGPVGWIIATVLLLVGLIIANWDKVSAFTQQAWANVSRFCAEAWENIKNGVKSGIDNVVSFVRDLPGKILSFFGNAGTLLLSAGGSIIQGFLDGLTSGFEEVKKFVGSIAQWIADNKGPKAYDLALLIPAGGWIMDGLQTGIEKSLPSLQKTLGGVSATIAGGVTGGTVGLSGVPGTATAGVTASAPAASVVSLHPSDRALLRAVAERPMQVKVGSRVVAEANIEGRKALRLPV